MGRNGEWTSMRMNAFVNKDKLDGIVVSIYSIRGLRETVQSNEKFRLAWGLCRAFNGRAVPIMNGEKILFIGKGPQELQKGDIQKSGRSPAIISA